MALLRRELCRQVRGPEVTHADRCTLVFDTDAKNLYVEREVAHLDLRIDGTMEIETATMDTLPSRPRRAKEANPKNKSQITPAGQKAPFPTTARHFRSSPISRLIRRQSVCRERAMCGRLQVGKRNLHVAGLVGAAMCSAFSCGSHDRWP
jgi:hypothetical protein